MQESTYSPTPPEQRLPEDAPNILIVLIDDAGPGLPSTFGGEVRTPTLDRVRAEGVAYNRFHTTAMCSPTWASLLTGRNQHRVGNGQIAELANDWDGYSGHIPKSSATVAEVLKQYGYSTAAWGKWHNTPAEETTAAGPFDRWPTGYGFDYFYGFLAGEASQYEPNLVRNTTTTLPPCSAEEGYHLSEDLADDAMSWLRTHKALAPDKPFFMYWASGAIHGPHPVAKEWADKYAGAFDDGWDAYRERVHAKAIEAGWIPPDAVLTERHPDLPSWDDIPEEERPFQRRLMEVAAGFAEHVDVQVGRLLDEVKELGYDDNTIVMYVWGDNGSSGEGQNGTISELLAQNGIPSQVSDHIATLEDLGGLDVLGSSLTDNMYHAGWAWAGSAPYKGMKLLASHLGGTRNPLVVKWPARLAPDMTPRTQFHHVIDVVTTIYEIIGISQPEEVNGIHQDSIDGVSFAYSLEHPDEPGRRLTQYFEVMGSRSIYSNGWMASAEGPRLPRIPGLPPGIKTWTPDEDPWELYNLDEDWTQARDLASENPEKLEQLKELFIIEAAKNDDVLPVGGGLWVMPLHPEYRLTTPYTAWDMAGDTTRIPECCAPALGNKPNVVSIEATLPDRANGVLYKLGGAGGGLTCYLKDGVLTYEYNLFLIQRTIIRSGNAIPAGDATIEIRTTYAEPRPAGPLNIALMANNRDVGSGVVPVSAPCCLQRTTVSTSVGLSAGRCPSSTGRRCRSRSTAGFAASTSNTSRPNERCRPIHDTSYPNGHVDIGAQRHEPSAGRGDRGKAGSHELGAVLYDDERPVVEIEVSRYTIDRSQVTNAEFSRFVEESRYLTTAQLSPPSSEHGRPTRRQRDGSEGRFSFVCAEVPPPVPACRAVATITQHVDKPHRLPVPRTSSRHRGGHFDGRPVRHRNGVQNAHRRGN